MNKEKLQLSKHYLNKILSMAGQSLSKSQTNHIMMLYFIVHGLDLLDSLTSSQKTIIKEYVLSLQIAKGGWAPSSFYTQYAKQTNSFNCPHIVFTYSALNILYITGGLEKVNADACLESVRLCQKQNGAYSNFYYSQQADLRFVYSAVAICNLLNNFSKMNRQKVINYINQCRNFDGGYGLRPNCESHSGAIYCALASLKMLHIEPLQKHRTLHFLANRQIVNLSSSDFIGVQGRVGKFPDSCYSFWVGASMIILTGQNLINPNVEQFIRLCYKENQFSFSKYPQNKSGDPIHTVHSIVGIKIAQSDYKEIFLERGTRQHSENIQKKMENINQQNENEYISSKNSEQLS